MDAAAKLGRNPASKHQIQPDHGVEQADAGRGGRTRLARPNSQARTRTGKYTFFFCSTDHVQGWQPPYPVDAYSCYISCVTNMKAFSVFVCVFFPFILDIKFVGRTSRGHTGGRSHRISHPPSFCGACLSFSREKDSAIPFPHRP